MDLVKDHGRFFQIPGRLFRPRLIKKCKKSGRQKVDYGRFDVRVLSINFIEKFYKR